MRKWKTILALALSAALSLSLLAGCGGGAASGNVSSGGAAGGETGRVYWLNFKPELDETDQKATMDFMVWLVSDPDASAKMVEQLGILPYKNAAESSNGFLADAAEYTANGCYVMPWVTNYQPNVDAYRATLVAALNQYNADQSDANWATVKTAFVEGWAQQYQAVNG